MHEYYGSTPGQNAFDGLYRLMKDLGVEYHVEHNMGLSLCEYFGIDQVSKYVSTGSIPGGVGHWRVKVADMDPRQRYGPLYPIDAIGMPCAIEWGTKEFDDHWAMPKLVICIAVSEIGRAGWGGSCCGVVVVSLCPLCG